MHQELFHLPFLQDITVKSYGTMMVVGFMAAAWLMRRLANKGGLDPILLTNAALYSLLAGIVGARVFFVIHYFSLFRDDLITVFAIWKGGLEFLGGVILAIVFILGYLWHHKAPVRRYIDVLAIGLVFGLAFGRIGCLLNGCCFGKPTDLPWGVRFPYGSFAYVSQINTNPERGRLEPHLKLPRDQFFSYDDGQGGRWYPKPFAELTLQQQQEVTSGPYRCLPVHPSQLYESAMALLICVVLKLAWEKGGAPGGGRWFASPGLPFSLMLVLYGAARFLLELTRDDNPYTLGRLTISQVIGIGMVAIGVVLMTVFILKAPTSGPLKTDRRSI